MHTTEPDSENFRTVISSGAARQLKQSSRNSPTKKGSRGGEPRTRALHAVPRGQRQVFDFHDPVGTKSKTIDSKNPSSTALHTSSSSAAHRTCSTMLSSSTLDTATSVTPGSLGKGIVLNGCKEEKSTLADNAKRKSPTRTKSRGGQPRTRAPHAVPRGQRSVFDFYDPVGTKHETIGSKNPSSTSLHTSSSSAAHRACSTMVSRSTSDTATSVTPGNMGKGIALTGCKDEKSTLAGNVKRKLKTVKGQNSQPNSGDYVSSNLNLNRPKQLKRTPVPHTPEFAEKVHQRLYQGYKTDPEKVNDKPPMASSRTHGAVLKSSSEGTTAVNTTTFHASVAASKPKSNTKADSNVKVVGTKATVGRPDPLRTLLRTQVSTKQQPKSGLLIKLSTTSSFHPKQAKSHPRYRTNIQTKRKKRNAY
jgi:hypothetical protein